MSDLFADKAAEYDARPVPLQISQGVFDAICQTLDLQPQWTVLDFGAGTGLICARLAPHVARIVAVDISQAMLAQLAAKPELAGRVEIVCHDLLEAPLDVRVDLVVSAMAMHHVADTETLLTALVEQLVPGGRVALADLDTEQGDFHPHDIEGVYHSGFDRDRLAEQLRAAGLTDVAFRTACTIQRDGRPYPVFLVTATKPG